MSSQRDPYNELVKRVLALHVILIVVSTALFYASIPLDLGFFWFALLAGAFGAAVSLSRTVQTTDKQLVADTFGSWAMTILPIVYGLMMAGVAYFLFVSQILSGNDGDGLLAMNLFPDFGSSEPEPERLTVTHWLELRPTGLVNAGKLMVWCFLAGYSESFVSGILKRLEQDATSSKKTTKQLQQKEAN